MTRIRSVAELQTYACGFRVEEVCNDAQDACNRLRVILGAGPADSRGYGYLDEAEGFLSALRDWMEGE